MKYNCCLLGRLYSTKCNYMQLPLSLCIFVCISCKNKHVWMPAHTKKKLYRLLYENRKYQSKMCTNSLYVTKDLQYKNVYENDQRTLVYLEHRGAGTGLILRTTTNLESNFHW